MGGFCEKGVGVIRIPPVLCLFGFDIQKVNEKAWILAKQLLCERGEDVPCEVCGSCLRLQKKQHESLLSVGEEATLLKLEDAESVRQFVQLKNWTQRRVALIHQAEHLNASAVNALLKTLEEFPDDTHFILTTASLSQLPATLRSRVQSMAVKEAFHLSADNPEINALCADFWQDLQAPLWDAKKWKDQLKEKEQFSVFLHGLMVSLKNAVKQQGPESLKRFEPWTLGLWFEELLHIEEGLRHNWDRNLALEAFATKRRKEISQEINGEIHS